MHQIMSTFSLCVYAEIVAQFDFAYSSSTPLPCQNFLGLWFSGKDFSSSSLKIGPSFEIHLKR